MVRLDYMWSIWAIYTVLTELLDFTLTANVSKDLFHSWTQEKGSDLRSEVKVGHSPDQSSHMQYRATYRNTVDLSSVASLQFILRVSPYHFMKPGPSLLQLPQENYPNQTPLGGQRYILISAHSPFGTNGQQRSTDLGFLSLGTKSYLDSKSTQKGYGEHNHHLTIFY